MIFILLLSITIAIVVVVVVVVVVVIVFVIVILQGLLILIYCFVAVYIASPEAQRRNSLEKQLERLDNDMSLLSKISILADTLAISHMVNTALFKDHYIQLILTEILLIQFL